MKEESSEDVSEFMRGWYGGDLTVKMLKRKKSLYTDKSNVYKNIRRCNEKMNSAPTIAFIPVPDEPVKDPESDE